MLKWICSLALVFVAAPAALFAMEPTADVRVRTVLNTTTTWDGTALSYPAGDAEITGLIVEIAPGAQVGWHLHPVPSFGMVLEGELEVRLQNGKQKILRAGDAVAEVVNTLHNSRNLGSRPVKLLVFYAGAIGQKLTIREGDVIR